MWITQPEHTKVAKDEVKLPEGPPARGEGLEGPYTFCIFFVVAQSTRVPVLWCVNQTIFGQRILWLR